jgi:hypothetical protein
VSHSWMPDASAAGMVPGGEFVDGYREYRASRPRRGGGQLGDQLVSDGADEAGTAGAVAQPLEVPDGEGRTRVARPALRAALRRVWNGDHRVPPKGVGV